MSDTSKKLVPVGEYWLNENRLSNDGKYIIHRNYFEESGRLKYKTHTYIPTDNRTHINDTEPVAIGFTAYAIYRGLHEENLSREKLGKTYRDSLYKEYYNHQLSFVREYGKYEGYSFQDTEEESLENEFIPKHIEVERSYIKANDKFFSASNKVVEESSKQRVFQFAQGYLNFVNNLPEAASCPKGLGGCLNKTQLIKLHRHLQGERSIKAREEDFLSVFSDFPLPRNFQRVKWLSNNQHGKPNEYHLRALLEVCGVNVDGRKVRKMNVSYCFVDSNGRPIALGNPKRDMYFDRHKLLLQGILK